MAPLQVRSDRAPAQWDPLRARRVQVGCPIRLESRRMSQAVSPLRRVPEVQLGFDPGTRAQWYPL
ncbi:MAG TPA: hypothetical protein VH139_11205, partial [Acidobacteriaceae bacterium]|nr:hypothetical protein [Acidobacteriaceae bacterium]